MPNIGEEIIGTYLKECLDCDFVDYNVETREEKGEIDVIGINLEDKKAYVCEVVTHLTTGLSYSRYGKLVTYNKLKDKFSKDIKYGSKYLKEFNITYMLWTPIVKHSSSIKYDQFACIKRVKEYILNKFKVNVEFIYNEAYKDKLNELREVASNKNPASNLDVLRYLQIEEHLRKHIINLEKRRKGK